MTDISPLTGQFPTQPISQPSTASAITSDFDTFLTLLTAQISNQDPLDPMKSEEFAVQLATFSGVEQQVQTNDLLEAVLAQNAGDEFTRMAGWIGNEVRATMPVWVDGDPVTIDPNPPISGSRHELVVRDESGAEVHRFLTGDTGEPIEWDGTIGTGAVAPGLYFFSVESFEGADLVATEDAATYGRVNEVRYSSNGPLFLLEGGVEIPSVAVSAVRGTPS